MNEHDDEDDGDAKDDAEDRPDPGHRSFDVGCGVVLLALIAAGMIPGVEFSCGKGGCTFGHRAAVHVEIGPSDAGTP